MSTIKGVSPAWIIGEIVVGKSTEGTITFPFSGRPKDSFAASKARRFAEEPEFTAIACFVPTYSANISQTLLLFSPGLSTL